jgi:hypothetical protein
VAKPPLSDPGPWRGVACVYQSGGYRHRTPKLSSLARAQGPGPKRERCIARKLSSKMSKQLQQSAEETNSYPRSQVPDFPPDFLMSCTVSMTIPFSALLHMS